MLVDGHNPDFHVIQSSSASATLCETVRAACVFDRVSCMDTFAFVCVCGECIARARSAYAVLTGGTLAAVHIN